MGPIQSLDDLFGMLRRRGLLIALISVVGIAASVVLASLQPSSYEAAAVLQVETPVVTDGTDDPTGTSTAQFLQLIEQRMLTRENLIAVIERHALFGAAEGMSIDQKVQLLRTAVRFQSVARVAQQAYGGGAGVSAMIIFARFEDPEQAARVANDFAQSILDESAAGQAARSRETMRFYLEEEARVSDEIVALEARIADFKNANSAALPNTGTARENELLDLDAAIRAIDQSLVGLLGERTVLQNAGNLRAVEQRQLETLVAQIDVMNAQKAALQAQRDALAASSARTPEIERELSAFDRQLRQLQDQYDVINRRLAEAETSQRLEERNQAERFTLLERAIVPLEPSGGRGRKLLAMGVIASLGLAFGLALALEMMNPVLRTRGQMLRQLDLSPVITIPDLPLRGSPAGGRASKGGVLVRLRDGLPKPMMLATGIVVFLVVMAAAAIGAIAA